MNQLEIRMIHKISARGVLALTGELLSGRLQGGDELWCHNGTRIPVLAVEFPASKLNASEVTIIVPVELEPLLRVGDTLSSD
jgi:hypothetical protein